MMYIAFKTKIKNKKKLHVFSNAIYSGEHKILLGDLRVATDRTTSFILLFVRIFQVHWYLIIFICLQRSPFEWASNNNKLIIVNLKSDGSSRHKKPIGISVPNNL